MSTRQQFVRNARALITSQVATWLLTFALTVFLPRYLGVEAMGRLNLANSLWAIAAVGINFGLDIYLVKEIARQPTHAAELVGRTFAMRAVMFVFAVVGMLAYTRLAHYPPETVRVIFIIGASTILWQWIGAVQAALQGLEQMHLMSLANIVAKAIVTFACIPLALSGQPLVLVASTYVLAAAVGLWLQLRFFHRLHPFRLTFDLTGVLDLMRAGLPYLLSGAFRVLYVQVDVVIISLFVDERNVGWYGTAAQLLGTLLFIPTVYIATIAPALSRSSTETPDQLARLMRRSFDLLVVLSIPVGLGVVAVAAPFVNLLYGPQFSGSGPILALFGIALIFLYQNMLIGQFLISTDRQSALTALIATATVCTVPLDLVLIPWCEQRYGNGALGGALSLIVTEGCMVFIGLRLLPPGALGRTSVLTATKALAAGLCMVGAIWWSRPYFVGIPIVIGAVVYPVALLALRAIPDEDLDLLRAAAARVRRRGRAPG
jgi:O-antigen/teichoic acid export membrane protein